MGGYGTKLPVTGMAMLSLGGTTITTPWIALAGGALVIGGFLAVRLIKPSRLHG